MSCFRKKIAGQKSRDGKSRNGNISATLDHTKTNTLCKNNTSNLEKVSQLILLLQWLKEQTGLAANPIWQPATDEKIKTLQQRDSVPHGIAFPSVSAHFTPRAVNNSVNSKDKPRLWFGMRILASVVCTRVGSLTGSSYCTVGNCVSPSEKKPDSWVFRCS